MVDVALVDRRDGGVRIGVGRQQNALGAGEDLGGLGQKADAVHLRHPLVGEQECDCLPAAVELSDGVEHVRVVVDAEQGGEVGHCGAAVGRRYAAACGSGQWAAHRSSLTRRTSASAVSRLVVLKNLSAMARSRPRAPSDVNQAVGSASDVNERTGGSGKP